MNVSLYYTNGVSFDPLLGIRILNVKAYLKPYLYHMSVFIVIYVYTVIDPMRLSSYKNDIAYSNLITFKYHECIGYCT